MRCCEISLGRLVMRKGTGPSQVSHTPRTLTHFSPTIAVFFCFWFLHRSCVDSPNAFPPSCLRVVYVAIVSLPQLGHCQRLGWLSSDRLSARFFFFGLLFFLLPDHSPWPSCSRDAPRASGLGLHRQVVRRLGERSGGREIYAASVTGSGSAWFPAGCRPATTSWSSL